ncbi:hypothetical protein [Gemmatimonas sp.]|uniref:hypothetical protein n=1 Tax=Gemmatimonas sp. TaxID=1962908 RepID=UPI003565B495
MKEVATRAVLIGAIRPLGVIRVLAVAASAALLNGSHREKEQKRKGEQGPLCSPFLFFSV